MGERRGVFTRIEKKILGETWAIEEMSLKDRFGYFQTTGKWPGVQSREVDEIILKSDIESTSDPVHREEKIKVAINAGFGDLAD